MADSSQKFEGMVNTELDRVRNFAVNSSPTTHSSVDTSNVAGAMRRLYEKRQIELKKKVNTSRNFQKLILMAKKTSSESLVMNWI